MPQWGCFRSIQIDADPVTAWLVQHAVALRTCLLHRPYGDQALFMRRATFDKVGGFPSDWPLLEDLALVKKLNRSCGPPAILPADVHTSGRRWRALGLVQTTLINQVILAGHSLGVDVHTLAKFYERTGLRRQQHAGHALS